MQNFPSTSNPTRPQNRKAIFLKSTTAEKGGTWDMRFKVNRGRDKYTGKQQQPIPGKHKGPRCKDGSLDMRHTVNKGKEKYKDEGRERPDLKNNVPVIRTIRPAQTN